MDYGKFQECPRCGERSLECLKTYAHCPNCNYSEDLDDIKARGTFGLLPELQKEFLDESEFEFEEPAQVQGEDQEVVDDTFKGVA